MHPAPRTERAGPDASRPVPVPNPGSAAVVPIAEGRGRIAVCGHLRAVRPGFGRRLGLGLGLGLALTVGSLSSFPWPIPARSEPFSTGATTRGTATTSPHAPAAAETPTQPTESLEAYLRGETAWRDGSRGEAANAWEQATAWDPASLPARLALLRADALRRPDRVVTSVVEAWHLLWSDFRTVRWLVRHGLLAIALAGTFAVMLLSAGLVARHLRAVHHLLMETLAWSVGQGWAAAALAWGLLAVPVLANLGAPATLLFWVFLCAYRFGRTERILALGMAAWLVLIGPALVASGPLWSRDPLGRDAELLSAAQHEPAAAPNRAAIRAWLEAEPQGAAPLFLDGMGALAAGRGRAAIERFEQLDPVEVPPGVLEVNLGAAWQLAGSPDRALRHYALALSHDPTFFEAQCNRGLLLATLGRYAEADAAFAEAARADIDGLRRMGRAAPVGAPRGPLSARWSAADLWSWSLRHPPRPVLPRLMATLLPLRSPVWAVPVVLVTVLLGMAAGRRLGRFLRVRVCYHCGRPVCRRCLVRVERHAYCRRCGDEIGGLGLTESTRVLIRRLLDDKVDAEGGAALRIAAWLTPGLGAAARGHVALGAVTAALFGLAITAFLFPVWGSPVLPVPREPATISALRLLGGLLAGLAVAVNASGIRAAERRRHTLRVFFSRDVDRAAA